MNRRDLLKIIGLGALVPSVGAVTPVIGGAVMPAAENLRTPFKPLTPRHGHVSILFDDDNGGAFQLIAHKNNLYYGSGVRYNYVGGGPIPTEVLIDDSGRIDVQIQCQFSESKGDIAIVRNCHEGTVTIMGANTRFERVFRKFIWHELTWELTGGLFEISGVAHEV